MASDSDYKEALDQSIDDAKNSIKHMKDPDYGRLLELEEENRNRDGMKKWLENNWHTTLEDLNALVDRFEQQSDKALDIQEEKNKLKDRVKELEKKKEDLEETVNDLKSTKRKLEQGISKKEDEIEEMEDQLEEEHEEKTEAETKQHSLERKVDNLQDEKDNLKQSLEHTEELLMKLRHHVSEFDEQLED